MVMVVITQAMQKLRNNGVRILHLLQKGFWVSTKHSAHEKFKKMYSLSLTYD
jgi:hypothetical protein